MDLRRIIHRFLACMLILTFVMSDVRVYAQGIIQLPAPGTRVALSPMFAPPLLKGIKVYRNEPFRFDFILDKGDAQATDEQVKADSTRLIKYFLASLTVPEKDLWVNLSPYEKDRIVPEAFGQTEMGRDLLAQDYILKQITASVIYPEEKVGKEFWDKVYAEALKRYGTTDIPVDTFNKVWIVPQTATVYENKDAAFVVESKLKVMLESDYVAMSRADTRSAPTTQGADFISVGEDLVSSRNEIAKNVLREIIIPALEKEVNEGQNFATLRQVYSSLILATWYKRKVKASILGQAYVDKQKTGGIDITDKNEKNRIWQKYVEAFKKGAYNYIKDEYDPATGQTIPRKYFSGGMVCDMSMMKIVSVPDTGKASLDLLLKDRSSCRKLLVQIKNSGPSDASMTEVGVDTGGDLVPDVRLDFEQKPFLNFPFYQDRITRLLTKLNYMMHGEDLSTQEKMYQRLLGREDNRDILYELSSLLRDNFPYMLSQAENFSNLEFAIKKGIYYKIAPHVYLTPVTGSFKRHLIFWADDQGVIKFAGEFMIPGQNQTRRSFNALERKTFAERIGAPFDYRYSVRVLHQRSIRYVGPLYDSYFAGPTDVLFYDYPFDGKRVEMLTRSCREAWASKMGITLLDFDRDLVRQSMECFWVLKVLGIYTNESHSGNLRAGLVKDSDGRYSLKVVWVADFQIMRTSLPL